MMHKAWSSIEEVPYCFSRSSVKFQGHIALKIVEFDPNWAFPDCNSSLNSPMAMKCCTKLETAKKRCPIVFQGHPSNFKVTRDKTSPILTQIGCFRTIGRSQLWNPSDLPCFHIRYSSRKRRNFRSNWGWGSNAYRTVSYFSCVLLGSFPVHKKLGTVQLKKNHFWNTLAYWYTKWHFYWNWNICKKKMHGFQTFSGLHFASLPIDAKHRCTGSWLILCFLIIWFVLLT